MSRPAPSPPPPSRRERLSFFRQSGWMLLANGLAGAFFTLVHTPVGQIASIPEIGKAEYATFGALLDSLILLGIPAAGLQAVFAQLASSAVQPADRDRLRTTVRSVLTVVALAWTVTVVGAWLGSDTLTQTFQVRNPWALGFILGTALIQLVYPVFAGLLQGTQNFLWLGNAMITSGAGRLVGVTCAVLLLGGLAAGALAGVMLGALGALALAMWASRTTWWGPTQALRDWTWVRPWLALTLGLAAGSVMLGADPTFVQAAFSDEDRALYVAAGRIGRALVFLTMPLALVLFPRVARSAATGEPTAALRLALGATLGTGVVAALVCTAAPSLPIRLLYLGNPVFHPAAELVPLFCWCMLPLTAAYTLVNNLLARRHFKAVPWLLLVAAAYAGTLTAMRPGIRDRANPRFSASEIHPPFLVSLQQPRSALDTHLASLLPPTARALLPPPDAAEPTLPPDLAASLAETLNHFLATTPPDSSQLFNGIPRRPETRALEDTAPAGLNQQRLHRMLLEDAHPEGLARKAPWRLLDEFRRVIRTLGFFSLLLLAVSILFSLRRGEVTTAAPQA